MIRKAGATRRQAVRLVIALAAAMCAATSVGATAATSTSAASVRAIEVLSNRADLVSGGDALVAIELAPSTDPSSIRVKLNGTDVTGHFALRENGRFEGLVTALAAGRNTLVASGPVGSGRQLTIVNHPIGGPVFAGPQVTPWICNTNASNPPLGDPIDAQCNAVTKVALLYRNTAGQFALYDPSQPPTAVQQTTTDAGKTVPFIVQRITGTADRGIYQIAVLVDPAQPITPWSTAQPWSHKLFYTFGGGCGTDHTQRAPGNVLQATQLGLGFAVATSSLNTYQQDCNDVVSAEATMMTKEIVTDRYGEILYTIGSGFSAGTMQIAQQVGLGAAVDYLEALGMDAVRAHEEEITRYALDRLLSVDATVYGPKDATARGGAVSFWYRDVHPHDLATVLDAEGVAIRAGHHCAQLVMRRFGTPATARASFYVYNTREEVDVLVDALAKAEEFFAH